MSFDLIRQGLAMVDAGYVVTFPPHEVEKLFTAQQKLEAALRAAEFGFNHVRCPVCAGWNGRTERDKLHSNTCEVSQALRLCK